MKRLGIAVSWLVGLYLIFRAIAEPFTIDMSDPATYENDWGGPSLFGVLLVHMGPGIGCAALFIRAAVRRRKAKGFTAATEQER